MALEAISGQSLYDALVSRLGGYANAYDGDELMSFLNEGMHQVWTELKNLKRNYFVATTQATDSALATYLAALNTTTREYALPADLREIRSISVTSPAGFEHVRFHRRDIASQDFLDAERAATADSAAREALEIYYYDLIDERTFVIAQFLEAAFVLAIRYVRALPELQLNELIDGIIVPWHYKILDYAAKKAVLAKHNESMTDEWRKEWREAVLSIAIGASARDSQTPQTVQGFLEE